MDTSIISSLLLSLLFTTGCGGLRLTNMTAPVIQDPRKDMKLHCRFDMGGEDLYAVKWYKDDNEFFRYTPSNSIHIIQFNVLGVHVNRAHTKCTQEGCDLLLTNLSRPLSSGAYRCEVSSEAPAFRLASQTHNVTVAVLPDERPCIKGLVDSYFIGDFLTAICTSGLGDPKPVLTWYINKQQVPSKSIQEETAEDQGDSVRLKRTTIQLRLLVNVKLLKNRSRNHLEISCVSSTESISSVVSPSLSTTKLVTIKDQNQLVNNQKLHSPFSSAYKPNLNITDFVLIAIVVIFVRLS